MKTITHPNIIKMIDSFIEDEKINFDKTSPIKTV